MNAPLRVLVLWFPDWPLRAVLGGGPHPPTALVQANTVVACTASARAHGVRIGQRRRVAQGLLSSLQVLPTTPRRTSAPSSRCCSSSRSTPPASRSCAPASRSCAPAASPAITAERPKRRRRCPRSSLRPASPRCVSASPTAPSPPRSRPAAPPPAPSSARRIPRVPGPYPVQVLRDEQISDLLLRLGVRTLGEFTALAPLDVRDRFGEHGARLQALAAGADSRPLAPRPPDPELARTVEFESPLGGTDQVAFAVRQTADAVMLALADASLVCTEVRIDLTDDDGVVHSRTWLHPTSFDAADLVDRVRWQLEALAALTAREPVDEARAFGASWPPASSPSPWTTPPTTNRGSSARAPMSGCTTRSRGCRPCWGIRAWSPPPSPEGAGSPTARCSRHGASVRCLRVIRGPLAGEPPGSPPLRGVPAPASHRRRRGGREHDRRR